MFLEPSTGRPARIPRVDEALSFTSEAHLWYTIVDSTRAPAANWLTSLVAGHAIGDSGVTSTESFFAITHLEFRRPYDRDGVISWLLADPPSSSEAVVDCLLGSHGWEDLVVLWRLPSLERLTDVCGRFLAQRAKYQMIVCETSLISRAYSLTAPAGDGPERTSQVFWESPPLQLPAIVRSRLSGTILDPQHLEATLETVRTSGLECQTMWLCGAADVQIEWRLARGQRLQDVRDALDTLLRERVAVAIRSEFLVGEGWPVKFSETPEEMS